MSMGILETLKKLLDNTDKDNAPPVRMAAPVHTMPWEGVRNPYMPSILDDLAFSPIVRDASAYEPLEIDENALSPAIDLLRYSPDNKGETIFPAPSKGFPSATWLLIPSLIERMGLIPHVMKNTPAIFGNQKDMSS